MLVSFGTICELKHFTNVAGHFGKCFNILNTRGYMQNKKFASVFFNFAFNRGLKLDYLC